MINLRDYNEDSDPHTMCIPIENMLVERNLRGMKQVQSALVPGYCRRAAMYIYEACKDKDRYEVTNDESKPSILIGTGFHVAGTFETDGPVGAIALYESLQKVNFRPVIVCDPPLSKVLSQKYRVCEMDIDPIGGVDKQAKEILCKYEPALIIAIERPGLAQSGGYHNMRGESINKYTACFDSVVNSSDCPTIGIGDGGNEIGMGNITQALQKLSIIPSVTTCDELIVADVSNWGAYGLLACLSFCFHEDLLSEFKPLNVLKFLSARGSVDGVTKRNEWTEDGLSATEGEQLIVRLREYVNTGLAIINRNRGGGVCR